MASASGDPLAPLAKAAVIVARKRTRFTLTDPPHGIGDADVEAMLLRYAKGCGLHRRPLDVAAEDLQDEADRILRGRLVDTLEERDGIASIASAACAAAKLDAREQQVAYCVAVLCQKDDPARRKRKQPDAPAQRTYDLDVAEPEFRDRLVSVAQQVARQLATDEELYATIHSEAADLRTATLERVISRRAGLSLSKDDVAAAVAVKPMVILREAPAVDAMSLDYARANAPAKSDYAFWSPLERWAQTIALRGTPWDMDELDDHLANTLAAKPTGSMQTRVERLLKWARALPGASGQTLDALIRQAEHELDSAESLGFLSEEERIHNDILRAELAGILDELRRERFEFPAMLTYVLLAMLPAAKRRLVAILSLRKKPPLPVNVIAWVTSRLTKIVEDGAPLAVGLVRRMRARGEPYASRATKLEFLLSDPQTLARVEAELAALPVTLADDAAVGGVAAMSVGAVRTTRGHAAEDLDGLEPVLGRAFRRYGVHAR